MSVTTIILLGLFVTPIPWGAHHPVAAYAVAQDAWYEQSTYYITEFRDVPHCPTYMYIPLISWCIGLQSSGHQRIVLLWLRRCLHPN